MIDSCREGPRNQCSRRGRAEAAPAVSYSNSEREVRERTPLCIDDAAERASAATPSQRGRFTLQGRQQRAVSVARTDSPLRRSAAARAESHAASRLGAFVDRSRGAAGREMLIPTPAGAWAAISVQSQKLRGAFFLKGPSHAAPQLRAVGAARRRAGRLAEVAEGAERRAERRRVVKTYDDALPGRPLAVGCGISNP